MRFIQSVLIITFLYSVSVSAQSETKCELSAFAANTSRRIAVYAKADNNSPFIKTVPADAGRTMFDVIGTKGAWLKITYAVNSENKRVFSGMGWVTAGQLSIKIAGADALRENRLKVYKSPSKSGNLISFSDFGLELSLLGCQGDWAKVQLPAKGSGGSTRVIGWMPPGAYCGNPWVKCD